MGRNRRHSLPQMRLHTQTGHARVRINGRTHWLGRFGSPEAQAAYDRLLAEYLANGRQVTRTAERQETPPLSGSWACPDTGPAWLTTRLVPSWGRRHSRTPHAFFHTPRFPFHVIPPLLTVPIMPPQSLTWILPEAIHRPSEAFPEDSTK